MVRDPDTAMGGGARRFPSTRESLIAHAASREASVRGEAVSAMAAIYWKPIYRHIRLKWGKSNEDAKDLTQGFLARLLTDTTLVTFDPTRASFRTYLRLCLDRFVGHVNEAEGRLKRGGACEFVAVDDGAMPDEPFRTTTLPPDELFHREWQRQMFALGIDDLRSFARASGKDLAIRVFEAHDLVDEPPPYADLAGQFDISVATVTNQLAWARRELRRLVLARAKAAAVAPGDYERDARALFVPKR